MGFRRVWTIWVTIIQVAIGAAAVQSVAAQEAPRDLLAAQIRDQGYRCNKAISAKKNVKRSRADEAVWVLRCDTGTYRLRLVPDMAARVQRLK